MLTIHLERGWAYSRNITLALFIIIAIAAFLQDHVGAKAIFWTLHRVDLSYPPSCGLIVAWAWYEYKAMVGYTFGNSRGRVICKRVLLLEEFLTLRPFLLN